MLGQNTLLYLRHVFVLGFVESKFVESRFVESEFIENCQEYAYVIGELEMIPGIRSTRQSLVL